MPVPTATREAQAASYGSTYGTHIVPTTTAPTASAPGTAASGVSRQACSWSAGASDGQVSCTATFTVPTGTYVGFNLYDAATDGTYRGGAVFVDGETEDPITFSAPGQLSVTAIYDITDA